ncbi:MAG: electron transfer flavoprotein subunit alpha [Candidatus Brocadiae bacterium]|nr:electron transfer flavoprotein subunit alpha [Candidatus Brocadiia bacterium]
MGLKIDHETCVLCLLCIEECPYDALSDAGDGISVGTACTLCGACVDVCPVDAISIPAEGLQRAGAGGSHRGVWVYGEHHRGRLHPVVFELIGKGAKLAEALDCPLEVFAAGHELERMPGQLAGLPVSAVYLAEHPGLAEHADDAHSAVLARLIADRRPEIVLAGATSQGRSLIPRVAVLCRTGLTADCTGLEIDAETGNLLQTRPAFGGNVMATIVTASRRPQIATVRPKVMTPLKRKGETTPQVHRWCPPAELTASRVEVLGRQQAAEGSVNIAEADVLVAGGSGVGGPQGFELLRKLASALGGEVAASRAAVDAGWIPYERQVGQTGKTVHPDLYVAVGISGAVQHRAGMQSSGTIVAVNSDPAAPIFEIADYGIVGDYREVLPPLIERLGQLKAEEEREGE